MRGEREIDGGEGHTGLEVIFSLKWNLLGEFDASGSRSAQTATWNQHMLLEPGSLLWRAQEQQETKAGGSSAFLHLASSV